MSDQELKQFIRKISKEIAAAVVEKLSSASQNAPAEVKDECEEWVGTKEACQILGLTPTYLRTIKDRFSWRKVGGTTKGRVLFNRRELTDYYLNNK